MVTGGTGHLGVALVRALVDDGWAVRVLGAEPASTPVPDIDRLGVDRQPVDLNDPLALADAFSGTEVVFHLAAQVSIYERDATQMEVVNVDGTASVLLAARLAGVGRLVHFSSVLALGPAPGLVLDESRPLVSDPTAPAYDRTKADSERLVLDAVADGLDAVVISPTFAMGPPDRGPSSFGRFLLELWEQRIPALTGGGFDFVDVRDVAAGAIAAAERAETGRRYLLGGTRATLVEVAEVASQIADVPAPRRRAPLPIARMVAPLAEAWGSWSGRSVRLTPASVRTLRLHPRVDTSRARHELGFRPRPLGETVRDLYEWFVETGTFDPSAGRQARRRRASTASSVLDESPSLA